MLKVVVLSKGTISGYVHGKGRKAAESHPARRAKQAQNLVGIACYDHGCRCATFGVRAIQFMKGRLVGGQALRQCGPAGHRDRRDGGGAMNRDSSVVITSELGSSASGQPITWQLGTNVVVLEQGPLFAPGGSNFSCSGGVFQTNFSHHHAVRGKQCDSIPNSNSMGGHVFMARAASNSPRRARWEIWPANTVFAWWGAESGFGISPRELCCEPSPALDQHQSVRRAVPSDGDKHQFARWKRWLSASRPMGRVPLT